MTGVVSAIMLLIAVESTASTPTIRTTAVAIGTGIAAVAIAIEGMTTVALIGMNAIGWIGMIAIGWKGMNAIGWIGMIAIGWIGWMAGMVCLLLWVGPGWMAERMVESWWKGELLVLLLLLLWSLW
jgi:hypothetical protein